jgi:pseudouridine kinase
LLVTPYISVVGGMNMDLVVQPSAAMVMGDSNPGRIQCVPGGVARNVAENLARLGSSTRLFSVVGLDALGQSLLAHTVAAGVDVSGIQALAGASTSTYLSLHNPEGDMLLAVNDMALLNQLTPALLQSQLPAISAAAVVVVDANLTSVALAAIFDNCAGATVFADAVSVAKCVRLLPWLSRLHTLKLNRLEAQALCGCDLTTPQEALAACKALQARGVGRVVLSLGAQGVCWVDREAGGDYQEASNVPVVNVSGAGDALLAGLVHGEFHGWALAQAVDFAVACAELTLGCEAANCTELSEKLVHAHQQRTR